MHRKAHALSATFLLVMGSLAVGAGSASAHTSAVSCRTDTYFDVKGWGEILYGSDHSDWNGKDIAYPATLHGKTVRLMNGRYTNRMYAKVINPSTGDIVSVDRAKGISGTTRVWWRTDEVAAQGGWDYCETKVTSSGGEWKSPWVPGWQVPVRVCLRHNGALQCTNIWRADNS